MRFYLVLAYLVSSCGSSISTVLCLFLSRFSTSTLDDPGSRSRSRLSFLRPMFTFLRLFFVPLLFRSLYTSGRSFLDRLSTRTDRVARVLAHVGVQTVTPRARYHVPLARSVSRSGCSRQSGRRAFSLPIPLVRSLVPIPGYLGCSFRLALTFWRLSLFALFFGRVFSYHIAHFFFYSFPIVLTLACRFPWTFHLFLFLDFDFNTGLFASVVESLSCFYLYFGSSIVDWSSAITRSLFTRRS